MRYRIYPYRQGSASARALADALEGRVLRLEGSTYEKSPGDVVINWGSVNPSPDCDYNKSGDALRIATNKLLFFQTLARYGHCVPYWTDIDALVRGDFPVVCRTVLAGHSGEGIVIADTREELVPAPLYTKYIKKDSEYRIHVGKRDGVAVVISEQRKVARAEDRPTDWRIRNLNNGFVFQRNDIVIPECVRFVAKDTLNQLNGVDHGAVDVIYNRAQGRAYVLELNTAPGIQGTTVSDYAEYFRSLA